MTKQTGDSRNIAVEERVSEVCVGAISNILPGCILLEMRRESLRFSGFLKKSFYAINLMVQHCPQRLRPLICGSKRMNVSGLRAIFRGMFTSWSSSI